MGMFSADGMSAIVERYDEVPRRFDAASFLLQDGDLAIFRGGADLAWYPKGSVSAVIFDEPE